MFIRRLSSLLLIIFLILSLNTRVYLSDIELDSQVINTVITLHVLKGYYSDDRNALNILLDKALELEAQYIRTDFWWSMIEPERDIWDENVIEFYRWLIEQVRVRGMDVIAIVLTDPPRSWLKPEMIEEEVTEYIYKILDEFGSEITYFQLFNEPNLTNLLNSTNPDELDAYAIRIAGKILKENGKKTIINMLVDGRNWIEDFHKFLNTYGLEPYIDILAIDHYPGTWNIFQSFDHWEELNQLFDLIYNNYPGKEAAIMETGYSTAKIIGNSKEEQIKFINDALTSIRSRVFSLDVTHSIKIKFLGWYALVDEPWHPNGFPWEVEKHFGVLKVNKEHDSNKIEFIEKPGFQTLKRQFYLFHQYSSMNT